MHLIGNGNSLELMVNDQLCQKDIYPDDPACACCTYTTAIAALREKGLRKVIEVMAIDRHVEKLA